MEQEYDFSQGKRGAVDSTESGKIRITIRLDEDIIAWFRQQVHLAGGGNYQTLINEALHQMVMECSENDNCFLVALPDFLRNYWRTHSDTYEEAINLNNKIPPPGGRGKI